MSDNQKCIDLIFTKNNMNITIDFVFHINNLYEI